tara:strand:- start:137 stop:337 length:201 start_codon:yes stop_codon:yes gene_type:complete
VNSALKGKLLDTELLVQQAANNTKEQFNNLPDLMPKLIDGIMDDMTTHGSMSKQALASKGDTTGHS